MQWFNAGKRTGRVLRKLLFMLTTERLPRQARDRHKEILEGKGTFCRRPRLG